MYLKAHTCTHTHAWAHMSEHAPPPPPQRERERERESHKNECDPKLLHLSETSIKTPILASASCPISLRHWFIQF